MCKTGLHRELFRIQQTAQLKRYLGGVDGNELVVLVWGSVYLSTKSVIYAELPLGWVLTCDGECEGS
jgi:hypothetical protein